MTAYSTIVAAMVAALQSGTPVSAQIYRARMKPIAEQHTTAVVVRLQDAQAERFAINGAPVNNTTTIAVECYARSSTLEPDVAVDTLLADVYARLAADTTLGGLASDVFATGIAWEFDMDAQHTACATLTYQVQHRTANLNIT